MPEYTGKNLNLVKPLMGDYVEQTIPQLAENMQKIDDEVTEHENANASTTAKGHVQLTNSVSSTSTTTAATPNSVKQAYDKANAALSKIGDTMTGTLTISGGNAINFGGKFQIAYNSATNSLDITVVG
jgi:phage-related tail fiber protein